MNWIPHAWANDLWESAKNAGIFGNLFQLAWIIYLARRCNRAESALLQLTISGFKIATGVRLALQAIERKMKSDQPARKKRRRR